MLTLLIAVPLIGAIIVLLAGRVNPLGARVVALITTVIDLQIAYLIAAQTRWHTLAVDHAWIPEFGVHYSLLADWISAVLVLLTTFLGVVAVAVSWREIKTRVASFHVWVLLLQVGVMLVFLSQDFMLFYLGWELMLIPMLFIIGAWGFGRKEYSAFKFVLFTFTGSIFMLSSILFLYFKHWSQFHTASFEYADLQRLSLTSVEQWWVLLGFLIGFGVKVPLFPLHTWLLDAYPNAPTAGSLLLSGILSKTGIYGIWRITFPVAPDAIHSFVPVLITLALIGIFYGAFSAFSQHDLKRLIAYSSFSHVNFILIGIFLGTSKSETGAVIQMVTHGVTTAALFLIAGMLQNKLRQRDFEGMGGLWAKAPVTGAFLLFFCFAALGLPGTGNFIGELYIIGAAFQANWWLGSALAFAVFLAAIYSLQYFTRTMHGPLTPNAVDLHDSDKRENLVLGVLAALLILTGFVPSLVTQPLNLLFSTSKTKPEVAMLSPRSVSDGRVDQ